MNQIWKLMIVVACPTIALAQTSSESAPYTPVVPAPTIATPYGSPYGGYSGYTGASTAAGSAMNGMSNMMSAAGQRNLSNSAAAVNLTQAQRNEIQNRNMATNTYFQMRAANTAARDAERGPPPTMAQLARIAKAGVPKPLSPGEMDHVKGRLNWPSALQEPGFESQRSEIDQLFVKRARYGGLDYADQMKARQTVESMFGRLKDQVGEIPPQDYVACRTFLQSVMYAATKTELN